MWLKTRRLQVTNKLQQSILQFTKWSNDKWRCKYFSYINDESVIDFIQISFTTDPITLFCVIVRKRQQFDPASDLFFIEQRYNFKFYKISIVNVSFHL